MAISRSGMGLSLARPIGKVRQRPLRLRSVSIKPGMKDGGTVKPTRGWGLTKGSGKHKVY